MTVPVQTPIVSYVGNGISTLFAFPFAILQSEDLVVLLNGAPQTVGANFTINGIGAAGGGSAAFNAPPDAGAKIIIYRDISIERDTDYQDNGDLLAATVNADFDRLWMALQDVAGGAKRAIQYPVTEFALDGTLPDPSTRANNILGFDANGIQEMVPRPSSLGAGDLRFDIFNAGTDFTPGVTTTLTLSRAPVSKGNCWAYWDSGEQLDFTLNGNQITFPAPIYSGINQVVVRIGTVLSVGVPAQGSVGDDAISWGGLLSRVVASIAALQTLSTIKYTHASTKGYYTAGDGGADEYFALPIGTALQWSDVQANDGGVWRRVFKGKINSKQLGLLGDGNQSGTAGTDQTTLFQSILNSLPAYTTLEFLPGYYNVKSVAFNDNINNCTFIFNDAWISGVATTSFDAVVVWNGVNNSKFYNVQIVSDGAATTVLHQQNYGCALQWKSDGSINRNTTDNFIYGINIRYIKAGIVIGNLLGQPAQVTSSTGGWIYGYQSRGVMQPLYGNAINAYTQWVQCNFMAQQAEANSSWWNNSLGFCVRNDITTIGDQMILISCQFQRAISDGSMIFGTGMVLQNPIFEGAAPSTITGDVSIIGNIDGFVGNGVAAFLIAPGSTGTLFLDNVQFNRATGSASFDRSRFVDGTGSINYRVVMRKCHLKEWYFDGTSGTATFVHGCQAKFEDVTIDNATTTSWYLDDGRVNCINNVDRSGLSIPTGSTSGSAGGWVTSNPGSGAYQQFVGDAPFGLAQSVRVVTTSAGFNLSTDTATRFKVDGNRDYHFAVPVKFGTVNPAASIDPIIDWYDYGGNLIYSSDCGGLGQAAAAASGFNSWLMYRSVVKAPVNAYTAVLRFVFGASSTILFCLPQLN